MHGRRSDFCQESRSVYFLPMTNPASRAFSFLDENSALISHRRLGGKRSGFALMELFCTKIQDGGSSPQRAADRKNRRSTEIFLTKIESPTHGSLLAAQPSEAKHRLGWRAFLDENIFFVRRSRRVPARSDLSDIPDFDFVTKVEFSSRGLGGGSAGRYLIAQRQFVFLTKIAPVFARAARGDVARNWLVGFGRLSSRLRFRPPVCAAA